MASFAFIQALPARLGRSSPPSVVQKSRTIWVCRTKSTTCSGIPTPTPNKEQTFDNAPITNGSYEWNVGIGSILSGILATSLASIPTEAYAVPEALVEAFKSKPASLMHPVTMWGVFGSALYTGWLGWQSRQIRSVDAEKRKELVKAKVTKRHFELSGTIFAIMTCATFGGMANTYTRTGKLFPGPHLYAGLGLVAVMSVMSALVPQMQSGKMWARNTHLALAVGAISLFGWQAKSGMVIVGKLLGWE